MADHTDRASDIEETFRQRAIAARLRVVVKVSETHCIDCDAEIPKARRQAVEGVELCIRCASASEAKGSHYAGGTVRV